MMIRSARLRTLVAALAVVVPSAVRRFLHVRLLGYEIHRTARIGHCLIDVESFRAGPGASVSSLSVVRGCERVEMGPDAYVGAFVWVNAVRRGSPALRPGLQRDPALVLGRGAGLTSMHFVDCCDRVELEDYAILGGAMGQILTHSFDYRAGEQGCAPVGIGAYTVVGTRSTIMPGTRVGARSIVAAGAVLTGRTFPDGSLLAGVPATVKAGTDQDAKMFHRVDALIH